jgi:beta-glucosidase-like glycosyl hydrolase
MNQMLKIFFFLIPVLLCAASAEESLAKMTLEEKIGQLFVMPACPQRGEDHVEDLLKLMRECHIGNLILKQSDPLTQVRFLNRLQESSKLPLLVTADAEWGLAMRMSDTIAYPKNMTLGAIQDLSLLEKLGVEIGRQAKLVGIHMNLAPVADVNTNPLNPIIHMRAFGEDPEHVADCVAKVAAGMRKSSLFTCVKHFPGHGDTQVDSHVSLPIVEHSQMRLQSVEWLPFKKAIDEGVEAIMSAHIGVPSLDPQFPATLSRVILNHLRDLNFKGLIITDALNMRALEKGSAERVAFLARAAGSDLLLYGDHIAPNVDHILKEMIPKAFDALKNAYLRGDLSDEALDKSVLKILHLKEHIETVHDETNLLEKLNTQEALRLKQSLFENAITLLGENQFPIPADTAYLSFGTGDVLKNAFAWVSLEQASCVVVAIHQKEAITDEVRSVLDAFKDKAIICHFASPYALPALKGARSILVGYENDAVAQKAVLRVLLGKNKALGKLPVLRSVLCCHPNHEQLQR